MTLQKISETLDAARMAWLLALIVVVTPVSLRAWKAGGFRFPKFPRWLHACTVFMFLLFLLFAWISHGLESPEQTAGMVKAAFLIPALLYSFYLVVYVLFGAADDCPPPRK